MTDPTAIRWVSLGAIAGALALAIWALRDPDAAIPQDESATTLGGQFKVRYASGRVATIELEDGAVLGRGADCAAVLDHPTVSKHHARIGFSGRAWIEDLDSTNGTFVNGRRIWGSSFLRRGDRIALGAAKIVFLGLVTRGPSASKG